MSNDRTKAIRRALEWLRADERALANEDMQTDLEAALAEADGIESLLTAYVIVGEEYDATIRAARAEGFRAARERGGAFLWSDAARDFLGGYAPVDKDLNRMVRWLARRIDAMEDAGEGGETCSRCKHKNHGEFACHESVPVPGEFDRACMCTPRETAPEPPLSQLRAATERMEAVAKPSPAAQLGEALELIRKARLLLRSNENTVSARDALCAAETDVRWVMGLEAETREGRR